ncbi:unnamed protein product [Meloidogyne enterolobii]|uniref:Uncharacterized protein n=1 Tax=Meloidogyne enterolobii TaxID=390850 RepID=A0ACB1AD45_MELEN
MIISSFNILAGSVYAYMQFFPVNEYIIYFGMFGWLFTNGFKPIIYLLLNKRIQNDVLKMFCFVSF